MESGLVTHSPSSARRNTSSTIIEEEYEASASSMAEEEPDDEGKATPLQHVKKNKLVGNYYHRRMSSGNSSTDSSVSISPKPSKLDKKNKFTSYQRPSIVFPFQNQFLLSPSQKRFEARFGPTSGYDGDTEGPLVEDKQH